MAFEGSKQLAANPADVFTALSKFNAGKAAELKGSQQQKEALQKAAEFVQAMSGGQAGAGQPGFRDISPVQINANNPVAATESSKSITDLLEAGIAAGGSQQGGSIAQQALAQMTGAGGEQFPVTPMGSLRAGGGTGGGPAPAPSPGGGTQTIGQAQGQAPSPGQGQLQQGGDPSVTLGGQTFRAPSQIREEVLRFGRPGRFQGVQSVRDNALTPGSVLQARLQQVQNQAILGQKLQIEFPDHPGVAAQLAQAWATGDSAGAELAMSKLPPALTSLAIKARTDAATEAANNSRTENSINQLVLREYQNRVDNSGQSLPELLGFSPILGGADQQLLSVGGSGSSNLNRLVRASGGTGPAASLINNMRDIELNEDGSVHARDKFKFQDSQQLYIANGVVRTVVPEGGIFSSVSSGVGGGPVEQPLRDTWLDIMALRNIQRGAEVVDRNKAKQRLIDQGLIDSSETFIHRVDPSHDNARSSQILWAAVMQDQGMRDGQLAGLSAHILNPRRAAQFQLSLDMIRDAQIINPSARISPLEGGELTEGSAFKAGQTLKRQFGTREGLAETLRALDPAFGRALVGAGVEIQSEFLRGFGVDPADLGPGATLPALLRNLPVPPPAPPRERRQLPEFDLREQESFRRLEELRKARDRGLGPGRARPIPGAGSVGGRVE